MGNIKYIPEYPPAVIGVGGRGGGGARRERCPARCAAYMCAVTPRNLQEIIFPLPSALYAPYTAAASPHRGEGPAVRTAAPLQQGGGSGPKYSNKKMAPGAEKEQLSSDRAS